MKKNKEAELRAHLAKMKKANLIDLLLQYKYERDLFAADSDLAGEPVSCDEFTLSDIKIGNVITVRNGRKYIYVGNDTVLVSFHTATHPQLEKLSDLFRQDLKGVAGNDIVSVSSNITDLNNFIWQRPLEFTDVDIELLKIIPPEYKWLGRNPNGNLCAYVQKPVKRDGNWCHTTYELNEQARNLKMFNHCFAFVSADDSEPYNIRELRKTAGVKAI